MNRKRILFEPWGLGDALIAFAVALQRPDEIAVACQSKWQNLLRAEASVQSLCCPELIEANLSYVGRQKAKWSTQVKHSDHDQPRLLSIRGDVRDLRAAREIFPNSRMTMRGWVAFAAKRSRLADLPFAKGWLPVRSRYEAWARLSGVPWCEVQRYFADRPSAEENRSVVIHAGAQWRSKQYPHVAELAKLLRTTGRVKIVAGPSDPLPPGIAEEEVDRLSDAALVEGIYAATHVIANDSGPLHVAALLRRRTLAVTNHAAMREWLPPGVALLAANGHRGHRATETKPSDAVFAGWPTAEQVLASFQRL